MKLGLCLTGGGARGAYQIGACQALDELGIFSRIQAFSGTSIGAVNACLLATKTLPEIHALWQSITPDMLERTENIFAHIVKERMEFRETGVFEINGLASLLQQNLDFQRLREKQVFVTLSDGGETNEGIFGLMKATYQHYIKKDSKVVYAPLHDVEDNEAVIRQILASCSIPIAFAPQKMEDHQYFDGGVYDNVPVQPLIDSGCDTIIIIHLNLIQFFDPKKYPNTKFYEVRVPKMLGGVLRFEPEKTRKLFELGHDTTIDYFLDHPFQIE